LTTFLQIEWTEIPWDFFRDKNKLTDLELQRRFRHPCHEVFCPKTEDNQVLPLKVFNDALGQMRLMLTDLIDPRLQETFRMRAKAVVDYPNCFTLEDYLLEYRTGVYDNVRRKMINDLCHVMWGKECFGTIEKRVMDKVKLKYCNVVVGEHEIRVPTQKRTHGTIKGMVVRLRQTNIVERFRWVWRHLHLHETDLSNCLFCCLI
jgi:hypothetical protein